MNRRSLLLCLGLLLAVHGQYYQYPYGYYPTQAVHQIGNGIYYSGSNSYPSTIYQAPASFITAPLAHPNAVAARPNGAVTDAVRGIAGKGRDGPGPNARPAWGPYDPYYGYGYPYGGFDPYYGYGYDYPYGGYYPFSKSSDDDNMRGPSGPSGPAGPGPAGRPPRQ
ncbi:hypothetical protein PROFUN_02980 [Planoprotostelium fungivorum]|uniref:Uncharacterized protein n=1 Tax=Planoprotostelium fungivorum TaxID=1890364 RepID=A0A2P6NX97_9EUKA|nr:hypothetical protein PROFUN_02980 [Planoprotostelium fungivorum]